MDPYCADNLPFESRAAAGAALGKRLAGTHWRAPPIVLALPCGGVPVAQEVAKVLHAPWDVLVVRKIRHPHRREFAIGAVAAGGTTIRNESSDPDATREQFDALAAEQRAEVERREQLFRPGRSRLDLAGKTVIVIDDGIATGATMRAALLAAREMGAAYLLAAVPVGSRIAIEQLARFADEVVCLYSPEPFQAVGSHYAKFAHVQDSEVRAALGLASHSPGAGS